MKKLLFLICFALFTCYINNNNLNSTLAKDYIDSILSIIPYIDTYIIFFT